MTARITPDPNNANRGTQRGRGLLEKSLRQYGAGRSILVDKHGVIVAGNKTAEVAGELGLPVRVIETDGHELIAVQRTDLDMNDRAAKELAVADNRVGEVSLEWDTEVLETLITDGVDLTAFWHDYELAALIGGEIDDPNAEWAGMPEYENEKINSEYSVVVHFENLADLEQFERVIGQRIPERKKAAFGIWFPKREPLSAHGLSYTNEP